MCHVSRISWASSTQPGFKQILNNRKQHFSGLILYCNVEEHTVLFTFFTNKPLEPRVNMMRSLISPLITRWHLIILPPVLLQQSVIRLYKEAISTAETCQYPVQGCWWLMLRHMEPRLGEWRWGTCSGKRITGLYQEVDCIPQDTQGVTQSIGSNASKVNKTMMELSNYNLRVLITRSCEPGGSHQGLDGQPSLYLCSTSSFPQWLGWWPKRCIHHVWH